MTVFFVSNSQFREYGFVKMHLSRFAKNSYKMMKVITLNGFGTTDNFELKELEMPKMQSDEVLISIEASAFNPIDYQMRSGQREKALMMGSIMGIEFSGVIVDLGKDVVGFQVGDEVMSCSILRGSNGTYAEYISLPYQELVLKPKNINFAAAASLPVAALTAKACLTRMNCKNDDHLFINGASGGVGRLLISLLKYHDFKNIVVTAGNPNSVAVLKGLGVTEENIIDYHEQGLEEKILRMNNGNLYDHVVDLVGGPISEVTAQILRVNGNYVDVTFHGTKLTHEILFDKAATILNIAEYANIYLNQQLRPLASIVSEGKITVPEVNVVGNFSVETVKEAHRLMESNLTFGRKLVMINR
ncbi:NADPH:quinone reductase [Pedobacter caeni]|uniref:NADPH:quinone reductase n=2 Tax=Pedobacter caeni TaxID=288992 RepID=A0A1M5KW51_9SPHI|nr:NADPH:quinone reductase [Pedobacter caeni]